MSGRKLALLFVGAMAAALLAAPAGASALMLNYEGKAIPEGGVTLELAGTLNWSTPLGRGVDCPMRTVVLAETADAKVTAVSIETTKCTGTGPYAGCKVVSDAPTGLAWTAHPDANALTITDETIDYGLLCSTTINTSLAAEKVTATVDNASAIKSVKLSGTGTSGLETATITGEFAVLGEASGKLSIVE